MMMKRTAWTWRSQQVEGQGPLEDDGLRYGETGALVENVNESVSASEYANGTQAG
jgi:hypothetical protein